MSKELVNGVSYYSMAPTVSFLPGFLVW